MRCAEERKLISAVERWSRVAGCDRWTAEGALQGGQGPGGGGSRRLGGRGGCVRSARGFPFHPGEQGPL